MNETSLGRELIARLSGTPSMRVYKQNHTRRRYTTNARSRCSYALKHIKPHQSLSALHLIYVYDVNDTRVGRSGTGRRVVMYWRCIPYTNVCTQLVHTQDEVGIVKLFCYVRVVGSRVCCDDLSMLSVCLVVCMVLFGKFWAKPASTRRYFSLFVIHEVIG